jgi:uncharacterized OB-fold protein
VAEQIPVVDYLVLGSSPHLEANVCDDCQARYFDRRNACANCGGRAFHRAAVATAGTVTAFTIVHRAAPGLAVPFVSAVVKLDDGTDVQANLIDTVPDPEHVQLGMPVQLSTYVVGTDDNGVEAVAFGFAPAA